MKDSDILIVGAGPAGAATSLFLSKRKIPHTIIDKASFPRDKICGDALSGKTVQVLNKINPEILKRLSENSIENTGSYGICFFAPNGKKLEVPFSMNPSVMKSPPGFISRRVNFDNDLFNLLDRNYATVMEKTELLSISRQNDFLQVEVRNNQNISLKQFKLVVGADGERSVVSKHLMPAKKNLSNYCAGLRMYYSGVKDMHPEKYIELHFIKNILPGYFWIFPMNDGTANVGIGMLSKEVSKRKINLTKVLTETIESHPVICKRFSGAVSEGKAEGWGLPLGSARKILSGDNFVLTGDAGSLIDPFTGEGIGNAMYSGMFAAETIEKALTMNDFSGKILSEYELKLYGSLGKELKLSHRIQQLAKNKWLFNYVVNKAAGNSTLRETFTCMFNDVDIRDKLRKPSFYFKLLFN
jgi:geranylgeranyl reductase family protein